MKKVLVTGADGFIGSHLTEALVKEGFDEPFSLTEYQWVEDILEVTPYVYANGSIGLNTKIQIGSKSKPQGVVPRFVLLDELRPVIGQPAFQDRSQPFRLEAFPLFEIRAVFAFLQIAFKHTSFGACTS